MNDAATVWDAVHTERRRLVDDLESLSEDRWRTASLCPGWTVHDVVAHLIDSGTTTRWGFLRQMVAARFDFDRTNDLGVARYREADPRRTLEVFRTVVDRTDTPPAPLATRLVEAYVHGEDIRRPLGIDGSYPPEHVTTALEYVARTGVRFGGGKERVEGIRLAPTDADRSVGAGRVVRGSSISLLLATSGRPVGPGELTGVGADDLVARR